MTKLEIYIDFESISSPFNWKVGIKADFPYAYSVGLYAGKEFKTKTFLFNFNTQDVEDVQAILRKQLLRDVRSLSGKRNFMINVQSTRFVSFSPVLEKKILNTVYRGIEVYDISMGKSISLSNATKGFDKKPVLYFEELKKWVTKNMDEKFVSKRGMHHDGALAALAGHILLVDARNLKTKFYTESINIRTLVKEITDYSKDDVVRMKFIKENIPLFLEVSQKVEENLKEMQIARKKLRSLEVVERYLEENDGAKNLDELKNGLWKELAKQRKKIEKPKD